MSVLLDKTPDAVRERTAIPPAPPRGRRVTALIRIGQLVVLAGILLTMQLLVDNGVVPRIYLASPTQIAERFPVLFTEQRLLYHTGLTLFAGFVGTLLGIVVGVTLGVWFGLSSLAHRFFSPFVSAVYAIPKVTIIPLMTLYLGIGVDHKIAIVFLFSVFVPLFSTVAGIRQVDERHLKVARTNGANRRQLITKVILPSASTSIFTAVRLEGGGMLVGTLFAEIVASKGGIGYLFNRATALYDTPTLFCLVIYVTVFAVVIIGLVDVLERKVLLRWKYE
jgi:NitT/TauT family transport system permease protein